MENKNDKIDELIDFCLSRAEIDCFTDEQFKIRNQYYEICGFLRILKDGYIERVVRGQICELMTFNITCPYCGRKYSIEKLNVWPEDNNEQTNRDI